MDFIEFLEQHWALIVAIASAIALFVRIEYKQVIFDKNICEIENKLGEEINQRIVIMNLVTGLQRDMEWVKQTLERIERKI
jgi:low affinity Fe/Cu permease